jgi:hypothetical protein
VREKMEENLCLSSILTALSEGKQMGQMHTNVSYRSTFTLILIYDLSESQKEVKTLSAHCRGRKNRSESA